MLAILRAIYVIMCMFALANSASALYKGGQGSTRCLGVWKPLLGGWCRPFRHQNPLAIWPVSSRAGVNLFHQFCYIADFAGISFRTLLVEGRT